MRSVPLQQPRNSHVPKALIKVAGTTSAAAKPWNAAFPGVFSLVGSDVFAAIAAQFGIESQRSRFRGVCNRQALEQCGMAGLSDATIPSAVTATAPARRNDDRVIETSIP